MVVLDPPDKARRDSATGADLGATWTGFDHNFAWGILSLAGGESLILQGGNIEGGALYVSQLLLGDGLDPIASLFGNGLNIYYDPTMNSYLAAPTYASPAAASSPRFKKRESPPCRNRRHWDYGHGVQ